VLCMDGTAAPVKLVLELAVGSDPIAGRLHLGDRDARPFSGYLELMSLLEEIRRSACGPTRPPRPDR
jgi:hypothetical protein